MNGDDVCRWFRTGRQVNLAASTAFHTPLFLFSLSVGLFAGLTGGLSAQGTVESPIVLRIEGQDPLYSRSLPVRFPATPGGNELEFKFGFETDEIFAAGKIFDSFTLTLQNGNGSITVVLLTADASGLSVAPATPGTALLPADSLAVVPIASPLLNPNLSHQSAFNVHALLPDQWLGQDAILFLDLFSNNDGVNSQGWLSGVVLVPEPSGVALLCLMGLAFLPMSFSLWKRGSLRPSKSGSERSSERGLYPMV